MARRRRPLRSRRDPGSDTPTAPLPDPRPATRHRLPPVDGLRTALGFGLGHTRRSWRPLLAVVAVQVLLAATVVVPFQAAMAEPLDHQAHAPALAGSPDAFDVEQGQAAGLDPDLWADVKRLESAVLDGLSLTLFWVIVGAWLFGAVAAGGFLGTAVARDEAPTTGRFFAQGGRWFGRMLRVGLVFLGATYLLGRIVFEVWSGTAEASESAATTSAAGWWGARWREGAFLLGFLWFRLAADLGRADLVVNVRRSAFLAFLRGIGRTVRHPIRTVGLALVVGVPAFVVVLALAPLLRTLGGDAWPVMLGAFLVVQVAVLARWASRAALLAGLVGYVGPRRSR